MSTPPSSPPPIGAADVAAEALVALLQAENELAVARRLIVSLVFRLPARLLPDDERSFLLETLEAEGS
jgi:hypothetical protein